MNNAEQLVADLCEKSFLSLWSYPNPRGKATDKELCDVLIVCDPDIIIFSVKDRQVGSHSDPSVNQQRWHKKAVTESQKQIHGAERWISGASHVITKEGKQGLPFPEISRRRIHRIAVSLGGDRKVPITFGDRDGKGFVHVFEEIALDIIMRELDTITDFVKYLMDKEALFYRGEEVVFNGGEEDLLAFYLQMSREFPVGPAYIVENNFWTNFSAKPEYIAKKEADKQSYIWDRMIEIMNRSYLSERLEYSNNASEASFEVAMRVMAKENRLSRRALGKQVMEFLRSATQGPVTSRIVRAQEVTYVFLVYPHNADKENKMRALGARCLVARGLNHSHKIVVGIGMEQLEGRLLSLLAAHLHIDEWTPEYQAEMNYIQKNFGIFTNAIESKAYEVEYPSP